MLSYITHSPEETQALARKLLEDIPRTGGLITLSGPLGSGKTHFTQGLAKGLGVRGPVTSPSYTLIKEYPIEGGLLVHMDAYRLSIEDGELLDLAQYYQPGNIIVVEWAELIRDLLPDKVICVELTPLAQANQREIRIDNPFKAFGGGY